MLAMPDPDPLASRPPGQPAAAPASTRSDRGDHPRPQLVRTSWSSLDGSWRYAADDEDRGRAEGWVTAPAAFDRDIRVPFPPESEASGIGERGFHPVVWYRRQVTGDHLRAAGLDVQGTRMLLHFGAVDYRAEVWLGGVHLGAHEGGHTPFTFDVTDVLADVALPADLVVRAEDQPRDVGQPRGKQDWQAEPHGIWYDRTTGIWQPVWLEAVPDLHLTHLTWATDLAAGTVTLTIELNRRPNDRVQVSVALRHDGELLADLTAGVSEARSSHVITVPRQANGQAYESLLWDPEHPRLVEAAIAVEGSDTVHSYLGLRNVSWAGGHFMLNDRPYYIRAVLAQGYWPTSHLAPPDADALRAEVQLAKDLGFNTIRMHQKVEDPRFLMWADRLGMLVWDEAPSAYEFSPTAVARLTREWIDVVRRDSSHPSVVTWVPLNESWGVQHIARDPAQLAYSRSLYHLTRALDPTRLVVSNDGWEQTETDLITVHDYGITRGEVRANYVDQSTVDAMVGGIGPLGRRVQLLDTTTGGRPVVVSEFGGVSYAPHHSGAGWGYAAPASEEAFEALVRDLFGALQESPVLAGFCYTQLTDTLQEANGLADAARRPKLPVDVLRSIVLGTGIDIAWQRRPKKPIEQPIESDGSDG